MVDSLWYYLVLQREGKSRQLTVLFPGFGSLSYPANGGKTVVTPVWERAGGEGW